MCTFESLPVPVPVLVSNSTSGRMTSAAEMSTARVFPPVDVDGGDVGLSDESEALS